MTQQDTDPQAADGTDTPAPTAMRGGIALLLAAAAGNGCNYLFTVVAGRALGPVDYGVLTALLALLMLVQLPLGSVQLAVARDVSHHLANGDGARAAGAVRSALRLSVIGTLLLGLVFLAAMVPLRDLLQLDGLGPLAVTGLTFLPTLATLVLMGALQGRQRYEMLGAATALPSVLRLVLFAALFMVGASLYGALVATAISALLALLVTAWWARDTVRSTGTVPAVALGGFLRQLAPVALGTLAITSLTNLDVLMVKARLSAEDAGIFAAASTLSKLGFFIPLAIVGVLFPRVAARHARGLSGEDILGRAALITVGFCVLLFGTYIALGPLVIEVAFGAEFAAADDLLALFAVGMTCFSLANILVAYQLSLGRTGYALTLLGGAALHGVALAVVPAGLANLLWVNAVVGIAVVIAYQLQCGGLWRAMQLGVQHTRRQAMVGQRSLAGYRVVIARRAAVIEGAVVVGAMAVLAVILTWPLTPNLGQGVLGGGDSFGTVAWLWNLSQEGGYSLVGTTTQTLTGAPFGWEQGNGVNVQWFIPYFSAHLASGIVGDIAAYNLVILTGITLSGAVMYGVVRALGGGRIGAALGGVAFASFPWLLTQADFHGGFTHAWGFPLLLLTVARWRARPGVGRALAIGVVMVVLCLTSGYYALMGMVVAAVALPIAALFLPPGLTVMRRVGALAVAGASAVGGVLLVLAVSRLGSRVGNFGTASRIEELEVYGARAHEYLLPPIQSTYLSDWSADYLLARLHGSNPGETSLYLGMVTLLLAAIWLGAGLARWGQQDRGRRFLLVGLPAVAIVGVLMSLPHPLQVAGHELPGPVRLLFAVAPEFRVPSRFALVVMTALAIMAALGLALLVRALAGGLRRRGVAPPLGRVAVAAVAVLVIGLSFFELSTDRVAFKRLDYVPDEYGLLAQTPNGIVAEYPLLPAVEPNNSNYLVQQRRHGQPLLNGAPAGTVADAFRATLTDPAAPGVARALAGLGITAVIDRRGPGGSEYPELGDGYRLVGVTPGGVAVWQVVADPGPAVAFANGFGAAEPAGDGRAYRWITAPEATILLSAPRAGTYRVDLRAGSHGRPRTLTLTGANGRRQVLAVDEMADHSLTLRLPAGASQLTVTTDPGPDPIPDGRSVSISLSDWALEAVPDDPAALPTAEAADPR